VQVPELSEIKGLRTQNSLLVCHSKDTVFIQKLSEGLEEWIGEKREVKFDSQITAFTFDEKRLYVALQTKQLAVYGLDTLECEKTIELGDECLEIIKVNGILILALKERDYWCITAELHEKLIPCSDPLTQLCQVDDCLVAKTERGLVRLRPIEFYDNTALYIDNNTIQGCDVFL
jgi:hypothetical protein